MEFLITHLSSSSPTNRPIRPKSLHAKIELEKLKMENARMREKCSSLLTWKTAHRKQFFLRVPKITSETRTNQIYLNSSAAKIPTAWAFSHIDHSREIYVVEVYWKTKPNILATYEVLKFPTPHHKNPSTN